MQDIEKRLSYLGARFEEIKEGGLGSQYGLVYSEIKSWCSILRARGASDEQRKRITRLEQDVDEYTQNLSGKLNLLREARRKLA